ncbi:hypothetical protein [Anaerotignum sp.]
MDYQDNLKIVEKLLSKGEILCQLAEETVELAEAITGYKHCQDGRHLEYSLANAFMGKPAEWKGVLEEAADVSLVIIVTLDMLYDENDRKIHKNIMDTMEVVVKALHDNEKIKAMQKLSHDIAMAALKLRRAMGTENPTPVTEEDAKKKLLCHLSVIKVLFEEKFTDGEKADMKRIRDNKAERWSKRLRGEANA